MMSKQISFLIILVLFSFEVAVAYAPRKMLFDSSPQYFPRLDFDIKAGTRVLSRTGMLLPVLQNKDSLLFVNMIGMFDNQKNLEGNFGVGLRHKLSPSWIIGGYSFWDVKRTAGYNRIHQATLGLELLGDFLEFRINGYLPKDKEFKMRENADIGIIPKHTGHQFVYRFVGKEKTEIPLKGFDIEIGGCLPKFDRLNAFVSYYHFQKQNNKRDGYRARCSYKLRDWFSLEGEVSYDNSERKWVSYVGGKLSYSFGRDRNRKHLKPIDVKMTQPVVRDIDIVTVQETRDVPLEDISFSKKSYPGMNLGDEELNDIKASAKSSAEYYYYMPTMEQMVEAAINEMSFLATYRKAPSSGGTSWGSSYYNSGTSSSSSGTKNSSGKSSTSGGANSSSGPSGSSYSSTGSGSNASSQSATSRSSADDAHQQADEKKGVETSMSGKRAKDDLNTFFSDCNASIDSNMRRSADSVKANMDTMKKCLRNEKVRLSPERLKREPNVAEKDRLMHMKEALDRLALWSEAPYSYDDYYNGPNSGFGGFSSNFWENFNNMYNSGSP